MAIVKKYAFVYIITNKSNKVLYTGVTSELRNRIMEHKTKSYEGSFTDRYNCDKLVWFEAHDSMTAAIEREKQLKGGSRSKKLSLINSINPGWKDIWDEIQDL